VTVNIAVLGGSQRGPDSRTRRALEIVERGAAEAGADTYPLFVGDLDLKLFNPGVTSRDEPDVARLLDVIAWCDGLIVGTPVYSGTVSGAVKNLIDHIHLDAEGGRSPLRGRVAGVVAVGEGGFCRNALITLEAACKSLGAWVDPDNVLLWAAMFDSEGDVYDLVATARLESLGRRITRIAADRRARRISTAARRTDARV
jgi:FMN reductase